MIELHFSIFVLWATDEIYLLISEVYQLDPWTGSFLNVNWILRARQIFFTNYTSFLVLVCSYIYNQRLMRSNIYWPFLFSLDSFRKAANLTCWHACVQPSQRPVWALLVIGTHFWSIWQPEQVHLIYNVTVHAALPVPLSWETVNQCWQKHDLLAAVHALASN